MNLTNRTNRNAAILLVVLISSAVGMIYILANDDPRQAAAKKPTVTRSKIVATHELARFTLIKKEDLEARKGGGDANEPDVSPFINRYLLVNIKKEGEVKEENLAPEAATRVLDDAVAVSLPASSTNSLGGQLLVGDLVELHAIHSKTNTTPPKDDAAGTTPSPPVDKFELVVLNVLPANKDAGVPAAITFAVPADQRDKFIAAVGGTELFVTRKISVHKRSF